MLSGQAGSSSRQHDSSSNVLSLELNTDGRVGASGFRATVSVIEVEIPTTGMCSREYFKLLVVVVSVGG